MDLLISEGIRTGMLVALTLVGSDYDGIDFDAEGQGYSSSKVLAATVRL